MRALFALLLASTTAFAQPKPIKPLASPKEVTVKAVYFKGSGKDATGGTTAVKVRLAPNPSGEASVGVMEEFSGGAGDQWRTAVWQAAVGASSFNRVAVTDYEFLVRVGGHIDGPSAGLLMASAFVALQRGKALKPDTTMTGTINPDGTAGPVGGIVQKMRGAAVDGIKRFGFPIGAREQVDQTTGSLVDLLALAEELKIEARELRTLAEAHEFLTGEALPPRPQLPESELELTVAESNAVRFLIQKVDAECATRLDEVTPLLKQNLESSAAYVKRQQAALERFEQDVQRALKAGDLLGAYFERVGECQHLASLVAQLKFEAAWHEWDTAEIVRQLERAGSVFSEAELLVQEVDGQFPPGLANDLFAFDINEDLAAALSRAHRNTRLRLGLVETLRKLGEKVPDDPQTRKVLFKSISSVLVEAGTAHAHFENARRFAAAYAMVRPAGPVAKAAPVRVARNEKSLYASGTATLAYFDAIVTSSAGAQAGLTLDEARDAFARKDLEYGNSVVFGKILEAKAATPRLRFTVAYLLHLNASSLANKYYALGAVTADDGSVSVSAKKAMAAQLDLAKVAMLESCAEAKRAGWIPMMARVRYLNARRAREGSDDNKLSAIYELWLGKFWCDLVQTGGR